VPRPEEVKAVVAGPLDSDRTMLRLVATFPDHLAASCELPGLEDVAGLATAIRDVVFCGMGGSAVAADLAAPLAAAAGVRLTVHREYGPPAWLSDEQLVVLASYSGETEEVLSVAAALAGRRGPTCVIGSGGTLAALARQRQWSWVRLPEGLPPRAALGHAYGALLHVLARSGAWTGATDDLAGAVATLRDGIAALGPLAGEDNPALATARAALGRLTVIYTTAPHLHPAGYRLKCQLNENAKSPALHVPLPEGDHNDIVGWDVLQRRRDDFLLLLLRSDDEDPRTARRAELTAELLADQFRRVVTWRARGETPLARQLSLVQIGDFCSCYLAEAAGVDPLPVARIEELKRRLKEPR